MAVKGKGKQIAGKYPASSASPSSSGKRKSTRADGESSGAPPKKKPPGVFQFIDDTAADADYEGEEEEEEDLDWEIDDDFDFELPDIGANEVKNAKNRPGKSNPLPFFIKEEEMNDDELEEAIKERYRGSGFVSFDEDVKEFDEPLSVAHHSRDLSVWRVKCMMGRERQAAFCLMQKYVDLLKIGKTLHILSVFAVDHVRGFVYVEADKACNVFEACNGLCIMYPSRIDLVPRNEAHNLLTIQKKACGISKGMWVRMKNGKYKGDLAEVVFINDAKKRVTVKLVPRIDLQAIAKKFGGGLSMKAASIPVPRLISFHELEDFRPQIEIRRDRETGEIFEVLDGLMLKDGYLYKKVSMCSLIHWGVQPSRDELAKFEDLGKDEVKDVSWLSSVYKARLKTKLPETSHHRDGEKSDQKNGEKSDQKNGEKCNQKNGDKQRNGFDIDDLVLFGKKDYGIVLDKENDTFKVLKGDVNGSEVVSIDIRVIKKNCIDKVFTASDRCMKTISINDVVKVSEGPLEGREGIVKHMYKGTLFIYDECQSENNGFSCVKSEICDLVKKSRDFGGGKSNGSGFTSFAQSPIRSTEQDDNSQSFSRNRQSNSRGTFSVGQTLRICKGPLKGYLCRVIRMHRADITVKLDSLGKLLTVDEKLLSISKRDDATAVQCDMFGSHEDNSIGGLLDAGVGTDNMECNAGMTSFGRDSWNAPSCSTLFSRENDSKDQEQGAANSWGEAPSTNAEQSSWNKAECGEKGTDSSGKNDADAWIKASTKEGTSTGGWQNDTSVSKTSQTWNTKGADDGWDSAVHAAVEGSSDAGGWSKAKLSTSDSAEGQGFAEDGWNKAASKPHSVSNTETGGWEQKKLPSSDAGRSWDTKGAGDGLVSAVHAAVEGVSNAGGWSKAKLSTSDSAEGRGFAEDGWNKAASMPPSVSNTETGGWEQKKLPGSDAGGGWNTKGATADWKKETSGKDGADGFGSQLDENRASDWSASSLERSSQTSSWDKVKTASHIEQTGVTEGGWKKAVDGNQAAGWAASAMLSGTSSVEEGSQSNNWGKVESLPSSSGWEKSKAAVTETVGGWKATTDDNQAAGWGSSSMPSATPSVEPESQTSCWDKVSAIPSSSGWQKPIQADSTAKECWKKDAFSSEGQIDGWSKEKSSDRDQASGWNKASNAGGNEVLTGSWDKAKSSEGQGFGQESQGQWKAGDGWRNEHHEHNFGKLKDPDSDQGSGWSQGHSNNENAKTWGRGNSWNQQRDFDGGRGFSRGGRGRGRYGGRGGRNEDSSEKPNDTDGNWRFGRGRGRGRNGSSGYGRDNSDTREFGRGRGRGHGRGQGQGQRQFESSDWRNGQERFDGGFSNKSSSSWGGAEGSSGWGGTGGGTDWGKSRDEHSAGVMDEKAGWNRGNSYGSGSKPGWGTEPQDDGGSKNDADAGHASGWSKDVNTGKKIDNWNMETRNNDNLTCQSTDWKMKESDETMPPNSLEVAFADPPENKGTTSDDKWDKAKSSSGNNGDTLSWKLNSNDFCESATLNKQNEAADRQDGWTSKKVDNQASQPSFENENNCGKWKEPCPGGTADGSGDLGSSKGWANNNSASWDSRSSAWDDAKKEPTSNQGNWGGMGKRSSGDRSSDWNNGGGNKWSEQCGGQDKSGSWSRGSDFGGGGGRGRDNSFSRGRGRNSGGRHSYSWNGSGNDSSKKGNDGGQAFNANLEFKTGGSWRRGPGPFEGEKGGCNSGDNAQKGSWGGGSKSGENQADDDQANKQVSGWTGSSSASLNNKVESSSAAGSWNLGSSKDWSNNKNSINCDPPSSAWDSKKEPTSSLGGWGEKDSCGNQSSDWNSGSQGKSESWSRGSDFGSGRGGGRGRNGPFSNRGRGFGRNSGGRSSGNDGWQASNSTPEFKTGGSWNREPGTFSGWNTEKPSSGSWKSEGEDQPAGLANPASQVERHNNSWDSPAGTTNNIAPGWAPATKQSSLQDNNPWDSATVSKMSRDFAGNSGSSGEKQKNHLSETDRVGSWDTNNMPSEDANSNNPGSWNGKGSSADQSNSWGKAGNSGNGGNSGW